MKTKKTTLLLALILFLSIQERICFLNTFSEMFGSNHGLKIRHPKLNNLMFNDDRIHAYMLLIKGEQLREEAKERERQNAIRIEKENGIFQKHLASRVQKSFSNDFHSMRYI